MVAELGLCIVCLLSGLVPNAWFPPFSCHSAVAFRCSVLMFPCAIVPCRCRPTVAILPFHIATVAVAGENGNAGNVFPYG